MATNSMMAPNLISTPDRAKEINFTSKGVPKLNATNQPPPKKPRKKKK